MSKKRHITKMRHIYLYSLIFCAFIISCSKVSKELVEPASIHKELKFPDDWLGYWQGTLEIYNADGLAQSIPMAMDHKLTDTTGVYLWALIYREDLEKGRRNYYLSAVDTDKGQYQVDEKNGILINSYLLDNRLISTYEVMSNLITTVYIHEGDHMRFEVHAARTQEVLITGDTIVDGADIPMVKSYLCSGFQEGVLYPVPDGQKNTLSK
jgi:hypothetical protein